MKKITITASLVIAIALLSVVSVLAAAFLLDENGFRRVPIDGSGKPVCSDKLSWLPDRQKGINRKEKSKAGHNYCYEIGAMGLNRTYNPSTGTFDKALFTSSVPCAFWASQTGNLERLFASSRGKEFRWDSVDAKDRTFLLLAAMGRSKKDPSHFAVAKKVLGKIEKISKRAGDVCYQLAYDIKRYVNYPDQDGRTALWYAVEKGSIRTIEILLANGAEIELDKLPADVYQIVGVSGKDENLTITSITAKRRQKITILMLAVLTAKKDQTKVVDLLLTKDPDITKTTDEGYTRDEKAEDRIGYTALHMAAKKGYINVATSLLNACRDKKACLNARANVVGEGKEFEEIKKNGLTPWMVAKIFRKEELADYLLRSGTDVTDADKRIVSEVKPGYNAYASLKNKLESYLLSQGNPWGK